MPRITNVLLAALTALVLTHPLTAQDPGLKLAIGDVGLGIGDVPRLDGLRLNFRDRRMERVRGVNLSIWMPYEEADGAIRGLALGLPLTGAAEISGFAFAAGVGVDRDFTGLGVAPIGFGAGRRIRGVAIAGVGIGGGGDMEGLMIGGVGTGVGGDVRGLLVGGVGVGAGGSMEGIAIGGVGAGFGGKLTGVAIGGVGVGAGDDATGILFGGVGVGAGGDVTGLAVGGVGVGAGGTIRGVAVGGVGVGAARVEGLVVAGFGAGSEDFHGVSLAPAYFVITPGGTMEGVSVAAWNRIQGEQHGLTIGLLNVANELHGVQIGLINIARNKDSFRFLPLVNYHR